MITINVKELCRARGIKHPLPALKKAGITHYVAHEYIQGKKHRLVTSHIEILCKLLRCTPNDLFSWVPDKPEDDYPENPLQKFRKKERTDLNELLNGMSIEEIEEMVKERKKVG